jgi:hypothetical protein
MRLFPIVDERADFEDPRTQWLAYMRTRWYDGSAGPSLVHGTAGGLVEPTYEYEWRRHVPAPYSARFHPPWRDGVLPPAFRPTEVPSNERPSKPLIPNAASEQFGWLQSKGPDHIPLFALPAARTVTQIDPLYQPQLGAPDFDLIAALEAHRQESAMATLAQAGLPHLDYARTLPMEAKSVAGYLKRGADIVRHGGKFVVKAGKRVPGPVGYLGDAKDLWDFIQWVNDLDSAPRGRIPGAAYQPASNSIEFTMRDGTVLVVPVSEL